MQQRAYAVLTTIALLVGGAVVTFARGYWDLPRTVQELRAQQAQFDRRQRSDSARTDSLYRINAGVLSVLCFGLSDEAFLAARLTCGEAFTVSRIIAGERIQKEHRP